MPSSEDHSTPWIPLRELLRIEPQRPPADPYNEDPYYPDPYARF